MDLELIPYLECFKENNPGFQFEVTQNSTYCDELERFCDLLPYSIEVYCQFAYKVIALDGAQMRVFDGV